MFISHIWNFAGIWNTLEDSWGQFAQVAGKREDRWTPAISTLGSADPPRVHGFALLATLLGGVSDATWGFTWVGLAGPKGWSQ